MHHSTVACGYNFQLKWYLSFTAHYTFTILPAEDHYYTYDLAKCDAEGNYQITGRVDDAIRIKGVWLEVPKIESVMVSM